MWLTQSKLGWRTLVLGGVVALACSVPACGDDDGGDHPGTGGKGGATGGSGGATGGKGGASGGATGGKGGATGGKGGQATGGKGGGTGGKATGGDGGIDDDGGDGGQCKAPKTLVYPRPGCDLAPVCQGPEFDACLSEVCGCDGETLSGCGNYIKPWKHAGACSDGGGRDSGADASDAH